MILSLPPCSLKYAAFTLCGLLADSERNFRALVLHAPFLVVAAWQRAGLDRFDRHANAKTDAQILRHRRAESGALALRQRRRWVDPHHDLVEPFLTSEHDLEFVHARVRPDDLLDAPRVDDDAANL